MADPNIFLTLVSATGGYLLGSISFSRLIARWLAGQISIDRVEVPVVILDKTYRVPMKSVSATSLRYKLGGKLGLLASLLDMAKGLVPVLVLYLIYPDQPYHYVAAAAVLIGHDWPVYHRFVGGYGITVVYGSLMVIDWRGLLLSFAVAMACHAIAVRIRIGRNLAPVIGLLVLIPWAWFFHHDIFYLGYAVLFSIAYVVKLYPDAMAILKLMRRR
jgi:glycerol-3-phosphate acyltransferase PlsY